MESTRGQEFKVGLLVILGLASIIAIVLWTDPVSFTSSYQVTAFLDNAGGLRSGSPVTLSGLRIGEVAVIATNSDERGAIRATLRLNSRYPIDATSELRVLTSGIFGDSYMEFGVPHESRRGELLAQDGTATVRVVPGVFDTVSRQGQGIVAALSELIDDDTVARVDVLIANLSEASHRVDGVLENLDTLAQRGLTSLEAGDALTGELRSTVSRLAVRFERSLDAWDAISVRLDQQLPEMGQTLEGLADQGRASLQRLDGLMARLDAQLARLDPELTAGAEAMRETAAETRELVRGLRAGEGLLGQLIANQLLARDLGETVVNTKVLSERIADHPEILLWGQTREEQAVQRQRREDLQAHRAFSAGQRRRSAFVPDADTTAEDDTSPTATAEPEPDQ